MGFFVLLGLIAYVVLANFIVKAVGKYTESKSATYVAITVFVLIPTWDIIPGQLYHQYLCKTEGGIQVFKTVEVDRTYFLPDGQQDEKKLLDLLDWKTRVNRDFSKLFRITKYEGVLADPQTRERLGSATDFWYQGGWLTKVVLPDSASEVCPRYPNHTVSSSLWKKVILLRSEAKSGGL